MTDYRDLLEFYRDFPIKGVNFVDILPFLRDRELFGDLVGKLSQLCATPNVAAPEARAFLFATPLLVHPESQVRNIIPLRKKGKLPFAQGDLMQVEIMKEYGPDHVYFRLSDIAAGSPTGDVMEITFLDDVLATGGTARGLAVGLSSKQVTVNGKSMPVRVKEFVFLAEIDALRGRERLEELAPVKSVIHL